MRHHITLVSLLLIGLSACGKEADTPGVSPERAASNADFQEWVGTLPATLKAPKAERKSRIRGIFQGCLMATTPTHVVTCRCNIRAVTKTYQEPELGIALDRMWVETARPWKLAAPEEIAKVQARLKDASPVDPVKAKAVQDIQTLCGSPESLKDI
jgi:hypothetical protein